MTLCPFALYYITKSGRISQEQKNQNTKLFSKHNMSLVNKLVLTDRLLLFLLI